ncbi:MAG: T9SS type A sorting domain-containing protein [Saprospiraceae bacterium]
MPTAIRVFALIFCLILSGRSSAQPYFVATAAINGNDLQFKIKAVGGPITCGWSVFEFFFRNPNAAPNADAEFDVATIIVNTTDFPGLTVPYNGSNQQGTENGYTNYWFGNPLNPPTGTRTYNQNQEYLVCTITMTVSPSGFDFELCHNEPNFTPHYLALTDEGGNDKTNLTGTNKFYGPDTVICNPNCPVTTPGNNHILPLNGAQPVDLVDFNALKHTATSARLDWRTASEIDFHEFEIQRQHPDGTWERIGVQKGMGHDGHGAEYQFFDHDPPLPTVYYRLKMLDRDGSFEYSAIRSVAFDGDNALLVFPNPVADALHLAFGADMQEDYLLVEVVDWSGRVVLQKYLAVLPGAMEKLPLHGYNLPAGAYLFRASTPNGYWFRKNIVVQE